MSTENTTTNLFEHAEGAERYLAGTLLFSKGDTGDALYAVQDGEVDIIVNGHVVETVGRGGFFGELAMIDQLPRSSDAVVRTDASLVAIDQARFMLMVRQTPFFAVHVMRVLARRLRAADQQL